MVATPHVHPGRFSARLDDDVVLFLIGARVNRLHRVRSWGWVVRQMPRMMARLLEVPDLGLLHVENFFRGRTTLAVQYWRSLDDLHHFAQSDDHPHLQAWHAFNRRLAGSGDVGVWHETYLTGPGSLEAVYSDMPTFGLAAATTHVPVGEVGHRAAQRLAVDPS